MKKKKDNIFSKIINTALDYSSILFFISLFVFVTLQVILRYVFSNPLSWTEELSRFSMIWLTYIGAIIAMRENKHIIIDILDKILSDKLKKRINIVSKSFSLIFLLILFYYGVKRVVLNLNVRATATEWSLGIVYLCIPIGALGMIIFLFFPKKER